MDIKSNLFNILLDTTSTDAEKDDAVIELGNNFDDEETIDLLIKVSNENHDNEMLTASCGESIGLIYLRTHRINFEKICKLKGIALTEALSIIKQQRVDWYDQFLRYREL